jgi:hypothetical protein
MGKVSQPSLGTCCLRCGQGQDKGKHQPWHSDPPKKKKKGVRAQLLEIIADLSIDTAQQEGRRKAGIVFFLTFSIFFYSVSKQ